MSTLIESVVPPFGRYCLVKINSGVRQQFFDSVDDLVAAGLAASVDGQNAYYAMASFGESEKREQSNVIALKSFWLDVDCKDKDPSKDYANKEEGITAIKDFVKAFGFPRPTILDSGNGWHVYWILDEAIAPSVWQPLADKLKVSCLGNGLRIDAACTADSARILRIPNTNNYRFDPPSQVQVMLTSPMVTLEQMKAVIEPLYNLTVQQNKALPIMGTAPKKALSNVTKSLLGNSSSSFKKILQKSMAGSGCAQIVDGVANQNDVEEPMWRAILSIAHHCNDGGKAIHIVSNQYEGYDYDNTIQKAEQTKGPYTCKTFDGLRSGVCQNCPNFNKITSPIQLGHEVAASTQPVVIELPKKETSKVEATQEVVSLKEAEEETVKRATASIVQFQKNMDSVTIPVPPNPFIRGKNGGLYKRNRAEDGTFDDILIYENDFYVHARLYDPLDGQVLACKLHLPMDGVRSFNIPLRSVGSKEELRKIVCAEGIAANDFTLKELSQYLILSAKEMQQMQKEEKARSQMGWQDDNAFVIGNRDYTKNGIRHCPPSSATQNYQHMFRMEGDLSTWRKIVDLYDRPTYELHQFVFFFMLSSPLLKQINQPGMMVSLISDESGLGKSTLGKLCNSVWGHPEEMTSMPHDTVNAVVNRMGVFNNIGIYIDELTNKAPELISDVIYMSDHGRGKERMAASSNIERVNNTRWAQNTMATANASMRDKVSSLKASNEGENMRLFEFDLRGIELIDKELADETFSLMKYNYGVAGHIWASWLVENVGQIKTLVNTMQRKLDVKFGFSTKERKWSAGVAAAYATAYITKQLGLHNFNIEQNIEAMVSRIIVMRVEVIEGITTHEALVSDYLAEFHSTVLVINGLPDKNGLMSAPMNKNISRITARYEPDTNKLWVSAKNLRDYCVKRQCSYQSVRTTVGAKLTTKRLSSGSGVVAGPINALEIDVTAAGLDMSVLTKGESNGKG